ncbi:MAG: hypothetical protein KAW40_02560, partial [Candidatus Aenigmarchaeota archaeon]|nr:hypothetical protein [Candidatus Aenigmarchaeota archaeon]
MKKILWLIFLTAILNFSVNANAADPEFGVVYPFANASTDTFVLKPYLHQSFLDFLEKNSVQAVIDKDGLPITYFSEEPRFGCSGFCSSITINNYTFGSKSLDISRLPPLQIMEETMIIGNSGIEHYTDIMNAIRTSLKDDSEALADFERYLLGEQEGFLRGTYYDELYEDVWDYAVSNIQENPDLYGSLLKDLKTGNMKEAIDRLEDYMKSEFDINGAFDMTNLYSAIENGQLGNVHIEEFMRNVLERIAEMENIDIDLDDIDFEGLSELLNTDEFKEAMRKVSELMENNPEMFDRLADLAKEMM